MIEVAPDTKIKPEALGPADLVLAADPADVRYWQAQLLGGRPVGASLPPVRTWQGWVQSLCEHVPDIPPRLTDAQEAFLWRRAARAGGTGGDPWIAQAREAWTQAVAHGIREEQWSRGDEDARRCLAWARQVQAGAERAGRIPRAACLPLLLGHLARGASVPVPERIALAPGLRLPPRVQELLEALAARGAQLLSLEEGAAAPASVCAWRFPDEADEYDTVSRIAAEAHRQGRRVGVLVLDAAAGEGVAAALRRLPSGVAPAIGERPLGETPRGRAALEWLMCVHTGRIGADALATWSWLAVEDPEPWIERWRCAPDWSLAALAAALEEFSPQIARGARAFRPEQSRRRPGAWAEQWHQALLDLRVLLQDEEGRTPGELHAAARIREGLLRLAELDAVAGVISATEAARELAGLWEAMRVPAGGAVPVLPFEEGARLGWDLAIVVAADEARLPWGARPLPFAPAEAQREARMPDATAELARERARALWDALLVRSGKVVATHAVRRGEEEGLGPSPWPPEATPPWSADIERRPAARQPFADKGGVGKLAGWPGGGAWVLSEFARCPFRGQMRARWGLEAHVSPPLGLDAASRGSLAHAALASFWREVETSQELGRLVRDGTLEEAVRRAVDVALRPPGALQAQGREALLEPERARLVRLLADWLRYEHEQREVPFRVTACEEEREIRVAGVTIRIRIDRVDRDAEGRTIVLDYKTGGTEALGDWTGECVLAWQLPLYALAVEADAVGYARVRRGGFGFEGVGAGMPGFRLPEDLGRQDVAALRAFWRAELEKLVERLLAGEATPEPVDASLCRSCDLAGVCRMEKR